MNKIIAALVASTFALVSLTTVAADAVKKDDLTAEQRAEMRARADQMKTQRENAPSESVVKSKVEKKAHKAKQSAVHHGQKAKKTAKRDMRKARRTT